MEIYNEVKEEINDCYLYILKDNKIAERKGTMRIFKYVSEKEFVATDGRVCKIHSFEGVIKENRVWYLKKQHPDIVERAFRSKTQQELEALKKRVSKKQKILKGGFTWQKDM